MADDTTESTDNGASQAVPSDVSTDISLDNSNAEEATAGTSREKEMGGRAGPDPTRYGDWEKAGRCIDF